jgi:predicted protein tyrosine phosphatase
MSKFKVGDTIVTTDGKKENKWYKVLSIVINEKNVKCYELFGLLTKKVFVLTVSSIDKYEFIDADKVSKLKNKVERCLKL